MSSTIFILPGLFNSGPDHWQTHWQNKYGFIRIQQRDWESPVCEEWISTIDAAIAGKPLEQVVLIGHSLACCTVIHWANKYKRKIKAALLVGPSDVDAPSYPEGTSGFMPMPLNKLPFNSVVVASSNDEFVSLGKARYFADCWGSKFINAGALGHINSSSNLGEWPEGYRILQELINKQTMLIQHKKVGGKGMFYVGMDGNIVAELTYTMPAENKMIIDHTEVDDSLAGKGVGLQLVHTAVEYARTHNIKIIPLCPFAKTVFDKKHEYRDVLYTS